MLETVERLKRVRRAIAARDTDPSCRMTFRISERFISRMRPKSTAPPHQAESMLHPPKGFGRKIQVSTLIIPWNSLFVKKQNEGF